MKSLDERIADRKKRVVINFAESIENAEAIAANMQQGALDDAKRKMKDAGETAVPEFAIEARLKRAQANAAPNLDDDGNPLPVVNSAGNDRPPPVALPVTANVWQVPAPAPAGASADGGIPGFPRAPTVNTPAGAPPAPSLGNGGGVPPGFPPAPAPAPAPFTAPPPFGAPVK